MIFNKDKRELKSRRIAKSQTQTHAHHPLPRRDGRERETLQRFQANPEG